MKQLFILLSFLSVVLTGCSTDFDVAADWKEIPIVYGLLDASQNTQYLKVNKAFLDENVSAYTIAQNPDSLYLAEPTSVKLLAKDDNGNLYQTIVLQRVDAAAEGIVKEEGIFATNPYWLYKTTEVLNPSYVYHLEITTPKGQTVTAQTDVIGNFNISKPDPNPANPPINLAATNASITCRWDIPANGELYDLDLFVKYTEHLTNGEQRDKVDKINVFTAETIESMKRNDDFSVDNSVTYRLKADHLLDLMAQQLPTPDADVESRYFGTFDFEWHVGGRELNLFNQTQIAQQSIAASQITTTYSNIQGGYGLLSSRYSKKVVDIPISVASFRYIACNELTRFLKFTVHLSDPTYPDC